MRIHAGFLSDVCWTPRQVLHAQPPGSGSVYAQAPGAPGRCSRAGAHQAQQRCAAPSSRARSWNCARQRGRLHPPGATRTSLGCSSASAPKVTWPPRRRAQLNSLSQRPCGCWPAAGATAATRRRVACVAAQLPAMMWTCPMARTPPARSTALPSLAAVLASPRMQVGHAACPWQCT